MWKRFASVAVGGLLFGGCTGYLSGGGDAGVAAVGIASNGGGGSAGGLGSSGGVGAGAMGTVPLDCGNPPAPPAPLRRLTREQYANTLLSALGVEVDVNALPADQRAGVFASNFGAAIDDLGTEQYSSMAESVAAQAAADWSKLDGCARSPSPDCAASLIQKLGRRLYRRPLEAADTARYQALFDAFGGAAAFDGALRVVVQAMLQSPHFLYFVEPAAPAAAPERDLGAFEVATRLAAFVWNASPDDALLDAAAKGKLLADADVRAQAQRMLDDPRASSTIRAFHRQWLGLDAVDTLAKDPMLFPGFGAEQRAAMLDETLTFVEYVFRSADAKLETLLSAPYSFPKPPLFSIYGLPDSTAADGRTKILLDPSQRAGVLTQPAFLAVNAHVKVSAPIKRGNVVLKNVLCVTTPPPPPGVKTDLPESMIPKTMREQVQEHESNPACVGCHHGMDGVGLGFEGYDAVGAFRTEDAGMPVDASGTISGTASLDGSFNGAVELAKKLGKSAEARGCMTEQWYRYAVGRPEATPDACALQSLRDAFDASAGDLRGLIVAIAASPGFRRWGAPASVEGAP